MKLIDFFQVDKTCTWELLKQSIFSLFFKEIIDMMEDFSNPLGQM